MWAQRIDHVRKKLTYFKDSTHFRIHFGYRNPPEGRGLGPAGVYDSMIVQIYLEALEQVYKTMTISPWGRTAPQTGADDRTQVYVCDPSDIFPKDASPFMHVDDKGCPFIVLTTGSVEPTRDAELHRARAEAIHEATHVLNYKQRKFESPLWLGWAWFDEALAVYMETDLGNYDHLRFLRDWIHCPEVPLDDWSSRYQAGMFASYLAKTMGRKFLNSVWVESRSNELPLEALSRLLGKRKRIFASADPAIRDFFASGFCMSGYFLGDYRNDSLPFGLYARYGDRAVTESFRLGCGERVVGSDYLDHLSCRYYRFYVDSAVRQVQFHICCQDGRDIDPLKAELAVVRKKNERGKVYPFCRTSPPGSICAGLDLSMPDDDQLDHLVLVVSNCGVRQMSPHDDHDDRREFRITAAASD